MSAGWLEVADGVLVRRHAELDLSTGLVLGDGACLVVDTRASPAEGAELAAAIRSVTGDPCTVVITHAHFDHCLGTAALAPTAVWAHPACRDDLARGGAAQRAEAQAWYREQGRHVAVPLVAPVVPDRTVPDAAELRVGGRRVLLTHPGAGHTDHDLAVLVPDAGVLFAGDLVEQGAPPDFTDAYCQAWPRAVDALLALDAAVLVPGHGDPVDRGFVYEQRGLVAAVAGELQRLALAGVPEDAALERGEWPYPTEYLAAGIAPGYAQLAAERPEVGRRQLPLA